MNGNDAIIFDILKELSIAFKQVVMDFETIHGSVNRDKTVTAKILNKDQ